MKSATDQSSDRPLPAESACRATRIRIMLHLGQQFTRSQVADLMGMAQRWGYDAGYEDGRADELMLAAIAADYAYLGDFSSEVTRRDLARKRRREEADAAARLPRVGDFRGGLPLPTKREGAAV